MIHFQNVFFFSFPDTTQILHNGKTTKPFSFLPFLPSIIIHSFLPFPVLFMPSFLLLSSFSFFSSLTLSLLLLVACFPFYSSPSFMFLSIPRRNMLHLNLKLIHFPSILPFSCQTSTSLSPTISLSLSLLNIGLSLSFCLLHQPIPLRKCGVERTDGEE